jgi:hypothetical protein
MRIAKLQALAKAAAANTEEPEAFFFLAFKVRTAPFGSVLRLLLDCMAAGLRSILRRLKNLNALLP